MKKIMYELFFVGRIIPINRESWKEVLLNLLCVIGEAIIIGVLFMLWIILTH